MNLLKQPKIYGYTGKTIDTIVTLREGETKQARFDTWLAEMAASPPKCSHHPNTTMVLDRTQLHIGPLTNADRWPFDNSMVPGGFLFRAGFRCPSCRAAYALCPPEFHTLELGAFDVTTPERAAALARCQEFVTQVIAKASGWLLLIGRPGTGKTRLASGIVRELINWKALYVRQGELTVALRATYGHKEVILRRSRADDDTPPGPLEIAQAAPFLILDELGCNPLANDERLMLDELLKVRYDQHRPTVLISNLALDQFKEFLGDALADRIRHASGNGKFLLQFSGDSYRRSSGEDYLAGLP